MFLKLVQGYSNTRKLGCLRIPGQRTIKLTLQCVSLRIVVFLANVPAASLRITDCRGFSMKRNSMIFADHLGTMPFTTRGVVMEYSYRDCLSEEIEILRLMLYRNEFLGPYIPKLASTLALS